MACCHDRKRWTYFSTCQVRVTRFYHGCAGGRRGVENLPLPPICQLKIPVGTARPQRRAPDPSEKRRAQPRAPDPNGQRRTSIARSGSQWALPDLNGELQIPVGNAGPQRRAPDPSGQRRTSTASSRSQWALPDLNSELPIPVNNAGPQPRALDLSGHYPA